MRMGSRTGRRRSSEPTHRLPNTDGDRFSDGVEVLQTFTDPLVFDPEGGTISGRVFLDEDLSGNIVGAAPVAGAMVYLDLDFDGRLSDMIRGRSRGKTGATPSSIFSPDSMRCARRSAAEKPRPYRQR